MHLFYIILLGVITHLVNSTLDSNSVRQDFNVDKSKQNNNVHRGDQTLGGVHIFEFHAPGGGMGIGIKILVLAVIAIAVGYWCLKEKCRTVASRLMTSPVQTITGDIENALEHQPCSCHRSSRPATSARSREVFDLS